MSVVLSRIVVSFWWLSSFSMVTSIRGLVGLIVVVSFSVSGSVVCSSVASLFGSGVIVSSSLSIVEWTFMFLSFSVMLSLVVSVSTTSVSSVMFLICSSGVDVDASCDSFSSSVDSSFVQSLSSSFSLPDSVASVWFSSIACGNCISIAYLAFRI